MEEITRNKETETTKYEEYCKKDILATDAAYNAYKTSANCKINKMKDWFGKHKEEIKGELRRLCWYAVGIGVGYFVGTKMHDLRIDNGLMRMYSDGLMKFFDPATGNEVDIDELGKVIKKIYK